MSLFLVPLRFAFQLHLDIDNFIPNQEKIEKENRLGVFCYSFWYYIHVALPKRVTCVFPLTTRLLREGHMSLF